MSTLDSTSTLAEIIAAYADNAGYAEDGSTSKAAAFCTACRLLLLKLPKHSSSGTASGHEVDFDLVQIRGELDTAAQWLSLKSETGVIKHYSFENFR